MELGFPTFTKKILILYFKRKQYKQDNIDWLSTEAIYGGRSDDPATGLSISRRVACDYPQDAAGTVRRLVQEIGKKPTEPVDIYIIIIFPLPINNIYNIIINLY